MKLKNILTFILAVSLAACSGGGGSFASRGTVPTDPNQEEPPATPNEPNKNLSYDGATANQRLSTYGHSGFNVPNQLTPESSIIDCRLKENDAASVLFVNMGFSLNPYNCAISSVGNEGILPPTEFTIVATTADGEEEAKVTLAQYPKSWKAKYTVNRLSPTLNNVSLTWVETLSDVAGATQWLPKIPASIAVKNQILYVQYTDSSYEAYLIDDSGGLSIISSSLPATFDIDPSDELEVQVRSKFQYICSGSGIRQLAPSTAPNVFIPIDSPIMQTASPIHLEYSGGFLYSYNTDQSVFKYEINQTTGVLSFVEKSGPALPSGMPSCSVGIL